VCGCGCVCVCARALSSCSRNPESQIFQIMILDVGVVDMLKSENAQAIPELLIFTNHIPQESPIIRGSFPENDVRNIEIEKCTGDPSKAYQYMSDNGIPEVVLTFFGFIVLLCICIPLTIYQYLSENDMPRLSPTHDLSLCLAPTFAAPKASLFLRIVCTRNLALVVVYQFLRYQAPSVAWSFFVGLFFCIALFL